MRFIFQFAVLHLQLQGFSASATVNCRALVKTRTRPDQIRNQTEVVNKNINHLPCALRLFKSGRDLELE